MVGVSVMRAWLDLQGAAVGGGGAADDVAAGARTQVPARQQRLAQVSKHLHSHASSTPASFVTMCLHALSPALQDLIAQ